MKSQIKNRFTGNVQYECELSAEIAGKPYSHQLGFAVKSAIKNGADLHDADMRDTSLRNANLRIADLSGVYLCGADLRGADLRGVSLSECPTKIPNIHQAVYAAASRPGALNMASWHSDDVCGTTHCRAGWVVHLAGDAGRALEWAVGTPTAATVIYLASDPSLERVPDFYCDNETALADMKRLAEQERSGKSV